MESKKSFFAVLILFGIFSSLSDVAEGIEAETKVIVDLSSSPENSIVKLCFHRDNSSDKALLVTSLNLTHKDSPKRVDILKLETISAYVSHLTGWFVIQQQSQELWVGLTLEQGENHGELTLSIPGMLRLVRKYPEEYELTYLPSVGTLRDLASTPPTVQYAKVKQIHVLSPNWGEIVESETTGWKRLSSDLYSVDLAAKVDLNVLTIRRNLTKLAAWLRSGLAPFAGGLSIGGIIVTVLVGMTKKIKMKHRAVGLMLVLAVLVILVLMGGIWPLNLQIITFDGASLIGFVIPFCALAVFPKGWIESLKLFIHELRTG